MYKLPPILFFIATILFLCACGTSKNNATTKTEIDPFSPDYYNSSSNNLERLQRLMSGIFVFYHDIPGQEGTAKWDVNESNDSIMGYALAVGDVNKVGYWLYNVQFMTSVPNKPLYTSFLKLEQLSRDTILATFHKPEVDISPADAFQNKEKAFESVDFKKLQPTTKMIYVKDNNLLFKGYSELHPAARKKDGNFQLDYYEVGVEKTMFRSIFYEDETMTPASKREGLRQYLNRVRLEKSNVMKFLMEMELD